MNSVTLTMHTCRICEKSYQSRGSLTRHLRNHSVGNAHNVCPTCGVAFSRRDLLRRHSQIHRLPEHNPISSLTYTENPQHTSSVPRRRCHTACQPCRRARIKCNGQNPCAQCVASQEECLYTIHACRVSRVLETEGEAPPATGEIDASDSDQVMPPASEMLRSPVSNVTSPTMPLFVSGDSTKDVDPINHMDATDIDWADSVTYNTTSWPWLHENLFLQGNPLLNWPSDFCPPPLDLESVNEEPRIGPLSDHATTNLLGSITSTPIVVNNLCTPATASDRQGPNVNAEQIELMENIQHPQSVVPDPQSRMSMTQEQLVEELVAYAAKQTANPGSQQSRSCFWQAMSIRLSEAFGIGECQATEAKFTLIHMMDMYRENFSPLWPLLSGKDFNASQLHPLLFLTLASIGCMYGTPEQCKFGSILHEKIRLNLATTSVGLEDAENDILWLAQARLLIQVAALYFGQRRAFSYAQQLGAIIAAQARRMDLFSTLGRPNFSNELSIEQQIVVWKNREARKRLAFGILRADVFTSLLLSTRPFLSAEEIYLDLPGEDEIWNRLDEIPPSQLVAQLRAEASKTVGVKFCDLVRVAGDRSETLLNLNARGYELLVFGLQDQVWRFSHDRGMFPRLTGQSDSTIALKDKPFYSNTASLSISTWSLNDQLGPTYRQMNDLREDRCRITETLRRWEQSFTATRTTESFCKDRSSVMSSLLLLHISYLKLSAPLADLHTVAYMLVDKKPLDEKKLLALIEWAKGPEAIKAVDNVIYIWSLLNQEINRPGPDRANFNLLAFSALHHAAVVIWAFSGTHDEKDEDVDDELPQIPGSQDMSPISMQRNYTKPLLKAVVALYKRLIPRGWFSFAAAIEHIALQPFPYSNHQSTMITN